MKIRIGRALRKAVLHFLEPMVNEVRLHSPLVLGDRRRIVIHPTAEVQNALLNVISGRITVEENAFFGHNVSLLTGRHNFMKFGAERQRSAPGEGYDITIRHGAWIASNAIIVGPCEIGAHAVVAAGSVVTRNVLPYQMVAGAPARVIRVLQPPSGEVKEPTGAGGDPTRA